LKTYKGEYEADNNKAAVVRAPRNPVPDNEQRKITYGQETIKKMEKSGKKGTLFPEVH